MPWTITSRMAGRGLLQSSPNEGDGDLELTAGDAGPKAAWDDEVGRGPDVAEA